MQKSASQQHSALFSQGLMIGLPELSPELQEIRIAGSTVSAGFPSPAEDYSESRIDLNKELISRPDSTFFVKVKGNSMINAGIHNGDILIVDKSVEAGNNKIIIGIRDGEFTVKRLLVSNGKTFLVPENTNYPIIEVSGNPDFRIWGVVTYIIHKAQ